MDKINLFLHLEKGPRKGEVIDCKGRAKVTIGRVARGNTFVIKESAISQKHLLLEFKGDKWSVTDLDTSNGTIFNDAKLPPSKPRPLKNGDLIKIGAETIIRVQIEQPPKPQAPAKKSPEKKALKSQPGRRKGEVIARKDKLPVEKPAPGSVVASTENVADSSGKANLCTQGSGRALEDITLAEWFDQMEQWLPKHLNEISENIIGEMRARAKEFDAFILQKNPKDG
eukprot:Gb_24523 [translate_table: standard]